MTFLDALHSGRVLLMDGAMGTELQKLGLRDGENAAAWNVLHPERVRSVHEAYRAAGAQVLLTNSFLINSRKSAEPPLYRLGRRPPWTKTMALCEVEGCYRVAAVGPVAGPPSDREFADLREFQVPRAYISPQDQRVHKLEAALLETCSTPRVWHPVRRLVRQGYPAVLLSLAFTHSAPGKLVTFGGHTPEWFAARARKYGVAALGVNCGRDIGMDEIIEIVRRYRNETDLPLFARPNAGTPKRVGKRWVYPLTPEAMAERLPELLEAGVRMVGGCCGTTPAHIAALRPVVEAWNARLAAPPPATPPA